MNHKWVLLFGRCRDWRDGAGGQRLPWKSERTVPPHDDAGTVHLLFFNQLRIARPRAMPNKVGSARLSSCFLTFDLTTMLVHVKHDMPAEATVSLPSPTILRILGCYQYRFFFHSLSSSSLLNCFFFFQNHFSLQMPIQLYNQINVVLFLSFVSLDSNGAKVIKNKAVSWPFGATVEWN